MTIADNEGLRAQVAMLIKNEGLIPVPDKLIRDIIAAVEKEQGEGVEAATNKRRSNAISIPRKDADRLYIELGKVRAWLSGFAAARHGSQSISLIAGPPGADSLRQVQSLLRGEK